MNGYYAAGMLAGILAVAVYMGVKQRRERAPRYDERQALSRARAGNMAFWLLAALLLIDGFLGELGVRWATPFVEMATLALAAGTAYVLRCVWTDAYFALKEKPRAYVCLFAVALAINAASSGMAIASGELLEDGLLTFRFLNLMIVLMFASLLAAIGLRRLRDRREEGEA